MKTTMKKKRVTLSIMMVEMKKIMKGIKMRMNKRIKTNCLNNCIKGINKRFKIKNPN